MMKKGDPGLDLTAGYGDNALKDLNENQINWRLSESPSCGACQGIAGWPPTAGSYATTLRHFEAALDAPLPSPRNRLRCTFLLQDPRDNEDQFVACDPLRDPATLKPHEHRYFCLTLPAWRNLGLDRKTRSKLPIWPDDSNAYHFLQRYIGGRSWSYDGFLTYFLYLLHPQAAYITNIAKCHFGRRPQPREVYEICCRRHLSREMEMFAANTVLSFSSKARSLEGLRELCGCSLPGVKAVLYAYHPAAPGKGYEAKRSQFAAALDRCKVPLQELGLDVVGARDLWISHVDRLEQSRR